MRNNVLSDKQKYDLCKWIEANARHGLYQKYEYACEVASNNLEFSITQSNMESAERATNTPVVQVKEKKAASKVPEVKVDTALSYVADMLCMVMTNVGYPLPVVLKLIAGREPEIKPSTTVDTLPEARVRI
jgi:hypothetical protein